MSSLLSQMSNRTKNMYVFIRFLGRLSTLSTIMLYRKRKRDFVLDVSFRRKDFPFTVDDGRLSVEDSKAKQRTDFKPAKASQTHWYCVKI